MTQYDPENTKPAPVSPENAPVSRLAAWNILTLEYLPDILYTLFLVSLTGGLPYYPSSFSDPHAVPAVLHLFALGVFCDVLTGLRDPVRETVPGAGRFTTFLTATLAGVIRTALYLILVISAFASPRRRRSLKPVPRGSMFYATMFEMLAGILISLTAWQINNIYLYYGY